MQRGQLAGLTVPLLVHKRYLGTCHGFNYAVPSMESSDDPLMSFTLSFTSGFSPGQSYSKNPLLKGASNEDLNKHIQKHLDTPSTEPPQHKPLVRGRSSENPTCRICQDIDFRETWSSEPHVLGSIFSLVCEIGRLTA